MHKQERIQGLDLIKGICIILVTLTHSVSFQLFPKPVYAVFDAIMLKGFFVVSGYTLWFSADSISKSTAKHFISRKFISLIIPYVGFSILTIIWHIILCVGLGCTEVSDRFFGWMLILRDVFCMASGIGIGTLWFLPILFVTYSMLILLLWMTRQNKQLRYAALCISVVCFSILSNVFAGLDSAMMRTDLLSKVLSEYIYSFYRTCYGFSYISLGYLLHEFFEKATKIYMMTGMCLIAIISYLSDFIMLFELAVCSLFFIGSILLMKQEKMFRMRKILSPILFCGRNSLAIMIIHYQFLWPFEKMFLRLAGLENQIWLLFGINLLSTLFLVWVLQKNRIMNFLLNKK